MKILALDLSLNETGWAINLSTYGHLKPNRSLPQYRRIDCNLNAILELIRAHNVELVAIEDGAGVPSRKTGLILAEQQGVIKWNLLKLGLPVCVVGITAIKKFLTGDGSASKADMIRGVQAKYGVITSNDNEADAIALLKFVEAQKGIAVIEK